MVPPDYDPPWQVRNRECHNRQNIKMKWNNLFLYFSCGMCAILVLAVISICSFRSIGNVNVLYIDLNSPILFRTDEKFLSIGLDSSVIASGFKGFNLTDRKLIKLMNYLSPAYWRIGGNLADRMIFSRDINDPVKTKSAIEDTDGGECSYEVFCRFHDLPFFNMNGKEWLDLNKLALNTNMEIVFDLNVLKRFKNDRWNYVNSKVLIEFSDEHQLNLSWQLGNEPNAFFHKFNQKVSATQLGFDFKTLKKILGTYSRYSNSLLIGPDTTRPDPHHNESMKYIREFLSVAKNDVDVISWHHYYFNGRTVQGPDFLNPDNFDILKWQISQIQEIKNDADIPKKRTWLGETASAYGGGSPKFSDKFVATFIWLDKLGITAKMGLEVVVRQSIFNGSYALLDSEYNPNPDWWISILYKKLVGPEVVNCYSTKAPKVRLYCHCTKTRLITSESPTVTVFGMNLDSVAARIRLEGLVPLNNENNQFTVLSYTITCGSPTLYEKKVFLNGKLLELDNDNNLPVFKPKVVFARPYLILPPHSIVFWIVPTTDFNVCT